MPTDREQTFASNPHGSEFAIIHPETGNEVARYDSLAEAQDTVRWYGETYGRSLYIREVKAGSREVCLGIEDDA